MSQLQSSLELRLNSDTSKQQLSKKPRSISRAIINCSKKNKSKLARSTIAADANGVPPVHPKEGCSERGWGIDNILNQHTATQHRRNSTSGEDGSTTF